MLRSGSAESVNELFEIKKSLAKLTVQSSTYSSELRTLQELLLAQGTESRLLDSRIDGAQLTATITAESEKRREEILHYRLIDSLRFDTMPDRHDAIPYAYRETFEWVFASQYLPAPLDGTDCSPDHQTYAQYHSFATWLMGSNQLYWITGKPGAGKSTLMKFLSKNPKTLGIAQQWTRTLPNTPLGKGPSSDYGIVNELRVASYFFWNPGSTMQKSKIGLCKTLLYQLAKDDPDQVLVAFSDRWHRYMMYGGDARDFSWTEVWNALLLMLSMSNRQFLLFIDGLDEVETRPAELAGLILQLACLPRVKICTSSRPWPEFEDPFGEMPHLRMEDLTRTDIKKYVKGRLGESPAFNLLLTHDDRMAVDLIEDVVYRASGVFLWVYVVTERLLEGLREGDDTKQLTERLHELPTELDELFSKILKQVPPRHAREASEFFQFVGTYGDDATLYGLYLAQQSIQIALDASIDDTCDDGNAYTLDAMRRKIYSRCKCLLHVSPLCTRFQKVTFLHRTVRDYFMKPDTWANIRAPSPEYDAGYALAISTLLRLKRGWGITRPVTVSVNQSANENKWEPSLARAICFMAISKSTPVDDKVAFLDEIERVRKHYSAVNGGLSFAAELCQNFNEPQWAWKLPAVESVERTAMNINVDNPTSVFQIAFGADLDWYVDAKIKAFPSLVASRIDNGYPLTRAAQKELWKVVQCLLENNADPNHFSESGDSAWIAFLKKCQGSLGKPHWIGQEERISQLFGLFLDKNAAARLSVPDLKLESIVGQLLGALRGKGYDRTRRRLEQSFEAALRRDKAGRRLTFKGIRM